MSCWAIRPGFRCNESCVFLCSEEPRLFGYTYLFLLTFLLAFFLVALFFVAFFLVAFFLVALFFVAFFLVALFLVALFFVALFFVALFLVAPFFLRIAIASPPFWLKKFRVTRNCVNRKKIGHRTYLFLRHNGHAS